MIIGRRGVACNVSLTAQHVEHPWLDVAAGDDGDVEFGFWQLIGAKKKAGSGDGPTRFGYSGGVCREKL